MTRDLLLARAANNQIRSQQKGIISLDSRFFDGSSTPGADAGEPLHHYDLCRVAPGAEDAFDADGADADPDGGAGGI